MVEGGIAGESSNSASRGPSACAKIGDRTRFTVELRPDRSKSFWDITFYFAISVITVTVARFALVHCVHVLLHIPRGQPAANDMNDAPAPNRFSAVIEKIERLYTGKDSDDEDLDDIPDDDQYDTEDSFIDDAELDEYFEVDKSKTKHDGYFVNRGTLEKVIEPVESVSQQPKKRRRKEVAKAPGDNHDGQGAIKPMKVGKKGAGKSASSADKGVLPTSQCPSLKSSEDMKFQNILKNIADSKSLFDPYASLRTSHGDTSSALAENSDKQKTGIMGKNSSGKLREASENGDKSEFIHKSQSLKPNHVEESDLAAQPKDKIGMRERIDLNLPDNKQTIQPMKISVLHKKEGSSVKPKANVLEKAVRELEKAVAESRPPAPDAQDADSSGQSVKRRLPREIKQRLAKVSRLAHANNGKVSKELLNRLMDSLGHLIQLRTLKRHLKLMMTMSLSAKQEKDDKFQQTKKEVVEMIKTRIPSLMSKAAEQQGGGSGEFQEGGLLEKTGKGQICMDATLEDKICDLYDIFVDGLDEDATPQVRKLYAELAELWPKGVMDNHGIKRAICRAKERKRALNEKNKDQEKIRRKKVLAANTEETVRVESSSAVQSQFVDTKMVSDPSIAVATQQNRFSTVTSVAPATTTAVSTSIATSVSIPPTNVPNFERLKQEKVKVTQNNSLIDGRIDMGVKKKVKKRTENLLGEIPLRSEKLSSHQGDDRQKQPKHAATAGQLQNSSLKSSYDEFRFEPLT
uniref:Hpc2-related domain-containing protein n=1 Tax=Chenopodium quinoa TaxID=63459 RepID=A0A803LHH8_CHEQI